jgi:purine-binding chemotaxis protein CheW
VLDAGVAENRLLIVTACTHTCGLPLEHIGETMRPLPIEPVSGIPEFVRGVSLIRGAPLPVVDLGLLLSGVRSERGFGRFVTLKLAGRAVALGVDGVTGFRALSSARLLALPPLLSALSSQHLAAMGALDAELLVVLQVTRLLSEDVWAQLSPMQGSA